MPPPVGVDVAQMPVMGLIGQNGAGANVDELQRVSNREEDTMNLEPSMSGKSIVGVIIPPPEIRAIVDKTALFVARNGIDFENKIKERESSNIRFNFLAPTDPYHGYYKGKVQEFETGVAPEGLSQSEAAKSNNAQLPEAVREHLKKTAEFVPKAPPKQHEFCADPATINAFDLDLIRLTALFVARNGRQFLTQLMNREVRNYQFDFLKPQHSNFPYFTKLVEQYTKVIIPAKNVADELNQSSSHQGVLDEVRYRVGWEKWQKAQRDKENAEVEMERMAYAQIDWHDFVVVQTVDFQPSETLNLPPLCTPKDVGTRILIQQRTEAAKAAADSVAMEMDSDSDEEEERGEERAGQKLADGQGQAESEEDEAARLQANKQHAAYEVTQPVPDAPSAGNVVIRDYDPRKARTATVGKAMSEKYIISPLTNERIPADKLREHVRYSTVDPQYKEQRDREQMERQDEDPTSASGTEISRNIAKLAERRTDIFGVGVHGAEQTVIGKRLGEEDRSMPRPEPKTIWDGQQSTIDATTRAAQQAGSADQQLNQQISELHKLHGFVVQDLAPSAATQALASAATNPFLAPRPPMPPPMPAGGVGGGGMPPPRPPFPGMPPMPPGMQGLHPPPMGMGMPGQPQFYPPPPMPGMPPGMHLGGPPHFFPPGGQMTHPPHPSMMDPSMLGGGGGQQTQPGGSGGSGGVGDEPASKRPRGEETLEPEGVWLSRLSGPVIVNILPPTGVEGEGTGPVQIKIDITTMVGELRTLIQEKTNVPASKVKLSYDGMFMKDNYSLAYYNMVNKGSIQLHMKERGGRKK